MPWGDRTGPMGYGPMTGRGAGLCAGYPAPGYTNPGFAGGFRNTFHAGVPQAVYPQAGNYYGPVSYYGNPYRSDRFYGFGRGPGFGRGFGRGWFGRGRGAGRWW
jgi:hypothetical protein